jgi:DNA-binding CsgD family transcriptional regulator/phage portal protein BeeE
MVAAMSLVDTIRLEISRRIAPRQRDDWTSFFGFGGLTYPFVPSQSINSKQEMPAAGFQSYVEAIYKRNGIVFACIAARMMLFSQARFQFRRRRNGRPGELFGTADLAMLEKPWQRATTGDLLARTIQHADLAGNSFAVRAGKGVSCIRPDWMTIVVGSNSDAGDPNWQIDAEVAGYIYQPGGSTGRGKPVPLLPEEVAHFAPIPDPAFRFRGMSWITPVLAEIMGDQAATEHKLKFFEQGATPNMAVSLDKSISPEVFKTWRKLMEEKSDGLINAYKTLYLGAGATVTPLGATLRQADFKSIQGAGETRIAAAAGVPPIIVGLSEGLNAATYSNYGMAKRAFGDGTMAYLWQNMAGSFAYLVPVPSDAELWYDTRDIPFLQEDVKDAAEINRVEAATIKSLIDAGYNPDDVVDAVTSGDFSRLKGKHSGLYSVQLQPPGPKKPPPGTPQIPPPTPTPALPSGSTPVPAPKKADTDTDGDIGKLQNPESASGDADEDIGATEQNEPPSGPLTDRERRVASLIAAGLTNKEVAQRIDLSERTVERTVSSAMAKMGVKTRTELAIVVDVRHDESSTAEAIVKNAEATSALAAAVTKPRTTTTTVQKRDEKGRLEVAVQEEI